MCRHRSIFICHFQYVLVGGSFDRHRRLGILFIPNEKCVIKVVRQSHYESISMLAGRECRFYASEANSEARYSMIITFILRQGLEA